MVYNQTNAVLQRMAGYGNATTKVLDRWTATKITTDVPKAIFNDPVQTDGIQNGSMSQRWLEDGSFLRLKNVTLNYNIPQSFLTRIKMTSARVFVSGQNLALVTNYSGYDPESQNQQFKNSTLGTDYIGQPQPRTITAGINVNF